MAKNMKPTQGVIDEVCGIANVTDPIWAELGLEVMSVVDKSNAAYGDSTEKSAEILKILWPNGVPTDKMHDFRCMVSIVDKLSRIATDKSAFSESPWRDCAGYALLGYRHDLKTRTDRER